MISIRVLDDQKEIKQHGTREFPVAVYHYVMSECVLGYINWHWHDEIQLCVVTKGRMNFQVSGAQYLLSEGEGFGKARRRSGLCLSLPGFSPPHPRRLSRLGGGG